MTGRSNPITDSLKRSSIVHTFIERSSFHYQFKTHAIRLHHHVSVEKHTGTVLLIVSYTRRTRLQYTKDSINTKFNCTTKSREKWLRETEIDFAVYEIGTLGRNYQQTAVASNQNERLEFWTSQPATSIQLACSHSWYLRWGYRGRRNRDVSAETPELS